MPKTNRAADLLKILVGQKTSPADAGSAKPETAQVAASTPKATNPAPPTLKRAGKPSQAPANRAQKAIRGKAIQFYLHDADEKLIREFAAWLAPHRKRINDSLVVKAVLRAARTGPALLAAYDDAVAIDGRTKTHRKGRAQF